MSVPDDAVEFLRLASEADSFNRQEGIEDLKFRFGDQWPVQMQNSRQLEARPMFTINETDSYCRQVINSIRQQRPRGRCHPVNDTADVKIAEVITGIGRHIEVNSDADNAYDLAAEFAVSIGWGYWRMRTDFTREDSREQDIYIDQIENPFSVYIDPNSSLPDGSDSKKYLLTDLMAKTDFRREFPGAEEQPFREGASGDQRTMDWLTKEDIRVAEYFRIDLARQKLVYLSNGENIWADEMPPAEILTQSGIVVVGDRDSWKRKVLWSKVSAFEELEKRTLPGRWIPVIPVYGVNMMVDGKRRKFGMVRFARDPQRMVNYAQTSIAEQNAMAPKAKWLLAEGQDEGYENEWAQANNRAFPVLHYKPTDVEGKPAQPPQRLQPEAVPQGTVNLAMLSSQNLQRVLGMFDPVNLKHTGPKSGEAIEQEMGQSEQSNYHFYDNLTRSIKHTWRIILDWTPKVYDTQRVMRIIGDDGKPDLVTINEKSQGAHPQTGEAVQSVLNDVTVGEYDVVMEVGPGFNTKRQQSAQLFMDLLKSPLGEVIAQTGADLAVRTLDGHGMEALADRLAAANPLAQIDDKSDIPPPVQMKLKHQEQTIQQLTVQLKEAGLTLKFRADVAKMKDEGDTRRELMKQTGDAHEREITAAHKKHDTETYALSAQNVAEINALARILTSHTEHGNRLREMVQAFQHDSELQDRQLAAKSEATEPVGGAGPLQ